MHRLGAKDGDKEKETTFNLPEIEQLINITRDDTVTTPRWLNILHSARKVCTALVSVFAAIELLYNLWGHAIDLRKIRFALSQIGNIEDDDSFEAAMSILKTMNPPEDLCIWAEKEKSTIISMCSKYSFAISMIGSALKKVGDIQKSREDTRAKTKCPTPVIAQLGFKKREVIPASKLDNVESQREVEIPVRQSTARQLLDSAKSTPFIQPKVDQASPMPFDFNQLFGQIQQNDVKTTENALDAATNILRSILCPSSSSTSSMVLALLLLLLLLLLRLHSPV